MNVLRHAACVLLAAATLAVSPANATSFSTDQSDLWYIPSESGWGIQLVQRNSVIFATLFVYGPSGQPTWYTATMYNTSYLFWAGDLYATTGDYFEIVPFNPADVTLTNVGTMTWQAQTVTTGTLTYVVNGVTIVKNVVRQSLVLDDYNGHYAGYAHRVFTGCNNAALNGTFEEPFILDITQNGTSITSVQTNLNSGVSCTFSGTASEFGQMGEFDGSFACTDGAAGTGSSYEVQVTEWGISARRADTYSNPPGCQNNAWIGAAYVTTF